MDYEQKYKELMKIANENLSYFEGIEQTDVDNMLDVEYQIYRLKVIEKNENRLTPLRSVRSFHFESSQKSICEKTAIKS